MFKLVYGVSEKVPALRYRIRKFGGPEFWVLRLRACLTRLGVSQQYISLSFVTDVLVRDALW